MNKEYYSEVVNVIESGRECFNSYPSRKMVFKICEKWFPDMTISEYKKILSKLYDDGFIKGSSDE